MNIRGAVGVRLEDLTIEDDPAGGASGTTAAVAVTKGEAVFERISTSTTFFGIWAHGGLIKIVDSEISSRYDYGVWGTAGSNVRVETSDILGTGILINESDGFVFLTDIVDPPLRGVRAIRNAGVYVSRSTIVGGYGLAAEYTSWAEIYESEIPYAGATHNSSVDASSSALRNLFVSEESRLILSGDDTLENVLVGSGSTLSLAMDVSGEVSLGEFSQVRVYDVDVQRLECTDATADAACTAGANVLESTCSGCPEP